MPLVFTASLRHFFAASGLLPSLPGVAWVQSTWAGVEPLLAPSLRRDYVLTNARGVFDQPIADERTSVTQ